MKRRIVALVMCALMAVTSLPVAPIYELFKIEASAASVPVESLDPFSTLTSGKLKMTVGATETFKVMVHPTNATNKTLIWTSSDPGIVSVADPSVSSSGIASVNLKANSVGTVKITYTTTDGSSISGSFNVEVAPLVETLKISHLTRSITLNTQGEKLVAVVSPSNAGNQTLKWFSSDEGVCKVDYNGVLYPVSMGECYISVATTDGSDLVKTCRLVVANQSKSVSLNKSAVTLENGKSQTLYATVVTTDGSKHDAVVWSSSDTSVATVSQEGVVTAKYPGTATIKATTADGLSRVASCTVTVTQKITKIVLTEKLTVSLGSQTTLKAVVSPDYATDKYVSWSSDNTAVATVSSKGVVTAKSVGTAKITCKNSDGSASATCTVSVVVPAEDITLSSTSEQLWKGESVRLFAVVMPEEATDKTVTWISGNPNVATVSDDGEVVAVAGGTCTIMAVNSAGQSASCSITVYENATGIEIDEIVKVMYVGQTDKISARVLPLTATNRRVYWSSSDASVAVIEDDGTIKAIGTGECIITAMSDDGGFEDICRLTVNPKIPVTGVALDKRSFTMNAGESFQFIGMVSPSNASEKRIKWSVSDSAVATISSTGVLTGVGPGTVLVTATTYDGNFTAQCKVTVLQPVKGITVSDSSVSLASGKTKALTWNVIPSNATDKTVTWSSSNTSVAVVSANGVITAKNAGTAVISVKTADGGFTATCSVTVHVPVTGVAVSVASVKVPKGQTSVVTAAVTPSNATNKSVVWSSSDTSVATVDANSGKITGVAKGTATITCVTVDGKYKASCNVTVYQLVNSVKLDAVTLNLQAGKYKTVTAKISPSSATYPTVKWKSSNEKVAIVSSNGVIKAVGPGTATITAVSADGNAEASCTVKVTQPATGIKLDKTSATVKIGDGQYIVLKATVLPSNASNKNVTWTTSNSKIARVSQNGVVVGYAKGYVNITAKTADGAYSATCRVLVARGVTGIKLDKTTITMNVGKSTTITPTITPSDATNKTVKWSSDNNDAATVDQNGKVTAKGSGYATITAKTADGGLVAKATVLSVKPVTAVKLDKKTAYVDVGEVIKLTPVISPSDATIKGVTWKTSDSKVAPVSANGYVRGAALGEATITCTTNNGKKIATCKIYVVKKVTGVSLNYQTANIYLGKKLALKTTVYPVNATEKSVTYRTSNANVATVSSTGVITPVNVGTAIIGVYTKDGNFKAFCTVTVKKAPEAIRLGASSLSLKAGQSATLKYTVSPADATNRTGYFSSSDTKVAKVSSSGVITGVSKGTAVITVKTENGIAATCKVTVTQQVTSVEVTPAATVYTGKTMKLTANVFPADAQNKSLVWTSSDTSVVKVSSKGEITGMRAGSATVTVTSAENAKLKATCKVTVVQVVTALTFDQREVSVNKGTSVDLKYTLKPADATNKRVTFTSSDSSIASVTADGRVTGHKGGNVKITVTSQENKAMSSICYVTVVEPVAGVSLDYTEKEIFVGSSVRLSATVSPSDAHNKLVRWSSGDALRASVNSDGVVTALKSGTATITVTTVDGGYTASCVLTILQRATRVETPEAKIKVLTGQTRQLEATVLPADCYDKSYAWTSSDEAVASVTADGFVTAKAPGTVTLTCTSLESGVSTTVEFTVHEPVTGIDIEESEVTLYTPFTEKLTAEVLPLNASDKSLTWTSSDESVVRVSADGTVTAVGKGEATVTVTSNDTGISDTCHFIIFTGVEDIITEKDAYSLHENTSLKIAYTLNPAVVDDPRVTFTSSNEDIFTVSEDGTVTGIMPGEAELTIASVQNEAAVRTVKIRITRAVTDISLDKSETVIFADRSEKLNATVLPFDASDKTVIWTSDNEAVATVDADGTVTAHSRGFAKITATTKDGGFIAECDIEVVQLPEEISGVSSATVYMDRTLALEMTVLPGDTNDKTLTYTSSDESIATVDENGVVTPVKTGVCFITVSSVAEGVEKRVELTVEQLAEKLEINCRIPDLYEGQRVRAIATVLPATTTNKRVSWSSSDEGVATVDANGVITAVTPGVTRITAVSRDESGTTVSFEVRVVAPISGIDIAETEKVLETGSDYTVRATVLPEMAYDKSLTFESSDSETVSVDSEGNVKALRTGTAIITVTAADGETRAQIKITVIKSAEDIRLYRTHFNLTAGDRVKVEYDILPDDTTQTELIWTSSDNTVAKVDSKGVITAVGTGEAIISFALVGTSIVKTVSVTVE